MLFADRPLKTLGFERIAGITTTAVGLPNVPPDAAYAYIQADGGDLRWRDDGTNPTATVGHMLKRNDDHWYTVDKLPISFIRDTDEADPTNLHVTYYAPK